MTSVLLARKEIYLALFAPIVKVNLRKTAENLAASQFLQIFYSFLGVPRVKKFPVPPSRPVPRLPPLYCSAGVPIHGSSSIQFSDPHLFHARSKVKTNGHLVLSGLMKPQSFSPVHNHQPVEFPNAPPKMEAKQNSGTLYFMSSLQALRNEDNFSSHKTVAKDVISVKIVISKQDGRDIS